MAQIDVEPERAAEFLGKLATDAANADWQEQQKAEKLQSKMEQSDNAPENWQTMSGKAVDFTAAQLCPAWELTDDEKQSASQAIAEVLDRYFPGALHGFDTWHPIAKLIGTLFFIAVLRFDFSTGRLAPLQHRNDDDASGQERRPDDSDGGKKPKRKNPTVHKIGEG